MSGWIKLSRAMSDNWLWQEKPFSRGQAWIDLLMFANHKPVKIMLKGQLIEMVRGQQSRSEITLSESWGWSRGKVRRFLKALEADSMIVQQTNNATSIITICNYDRFQDSGTTDNTAGSTALGTTVGTAPEHQTVHSEEVKECKNDNNLTSLSDKPDRKAKKGTRLTEDWTPGPEYISFCQTERPDLNPMDVGARFRDYWISKTGAQASKLNWLATWRNWVRNEKQSRKQNPNLPYSQTTANNLEACKGWMPPEMRNAK